VAQAANAVKMPGNILPVSLQRHGEMIVSIAAVMIVGMLVVPLPHWMLDVLLVMNMAMTFGILLVTAYLTNPLEFSVFPSLLLVMTLFRLALNISATRLILLHASAGSVISAFGNFVVGGNYVVGIVVFLILVVIQFVVITNGAGRVAEVAARFTLDAMPGKQMAIDADLNAGLIDEMMAKQRREMIARESDFYGAMDGASKFVKGDAIAAIVMIIVNILGGFIIGMAQKNMDIMGALQTYTLLTVGEGLVTQIPALIMSTATGLIVTRAASDTHLGNELAKQILSSPKAISTVAIMLFAIVLVPGLPKLPFLAVAAVIGAIALGLRGRAKTAQAPKEKKSEQSPAMLEQEELAALLTMDPLELEVGYGLIPFADPNQGGDLLNRITSMRKQVTADLGMIVPALRVRDNVELRPNMYRIKLWGMEVAKGEIIPKHCLAISPGEFTQPIRGIETKEPAFGLPALWITEAQRTEAETSGYTVVDAPTVVITHLSETIKSHAWEILSRQDVQNLVENLKVHTPAAVEEVTPKMLGLSEIHRVLQNLLRERVSIKDLNKILSVLGDYAAAIKDVDQLTEFVRQGLARGISRRYQAPDGSLEVITVDPNIENILQSGLRPSPGGMQLAIEPAMVNKIIEAIGKQVKKATNNGAQAILLCSPGTRPLLWALLHRRLPSIVVLSHAEIADEVEARSIGMVSLDANS
jgi:flagellar biosynthesis protein FlhA